MHPRERSDRRRRRLPPARCRRWSSRWRSSRRSRLSPWGPRTRQSRPGLPACWPRRIRLRPLLDAGGLAGLPSGSPRPPTGRTGLLDRP